MWSSLYIYYICMSISACDELQLRNSCVQLSIRAPGGLILDPRLPSLTICCESYLYTLLLCTTLYSLYLYIYIYVYTRRYKYTIGPLQVCGLNFWIRALLSQFLQSTGLFLRRLAGVCSHCYISIYIYIYVYVLQSCIYVPQTLRRYCSRDDQASDYYRMYIHIYIGSIILSTRNPLFPYPGVFFGSASPCLCSL